MFLFFPNVTEIQPVIGTKIYDHFFYRGADGGSGSVAPSKQPTALDRRRILCSRLTAGLPNMAINMGRPATPVGR